LVALGYGEDVEIAAEYDAAEVVPWLAGDRFLDTRRALP
jgi:phosphosulfolactate phosphohydrolase-like enzyme